jgi:hypothetical protein
MKNERPYKGGKASFITYIWVDKRNFILHINKLCGIQRKPTRKQAHLVFADTQSQS